VSRSVAALLLVALLAVAAGCTAFGTSAADVTVENDEPTGYQMTVYVIEEPVGAGNVTFRATNDTGVRRSIGLAQLDREGPYYARRGVERHGAAAGRSRERDDDDLVRGVGAGRCRRLRVRDPERTGGTERVQRVSRQVAEPHVRVLGRPRERLPIALSREGLNPSRRARRRGVPDWQSSRRRWGRTDSPLTRRRLPGSGTHRTVTAGRFRCSEAAVRRDISGFPSILSATRLQ